MNYPIQNPDTKPAQVTGRVVFIKDATEFTPAKLMELMNEGFVPVAVTESNGTTSFAFASFGEAEGTYTLTIGNDSFTSTDPDTEFAAA